MIERTVYNTLNRLVNEFPIIAITGPRQSCKKTIAMKAFPDKSYLSKNIFFVYFVCFVV
jgi:predicted AAA+ superfamily ATPase